MNYIFLAGGRTGGPIIPLIATSQSLLDYTPIILGIKNSFEEKYAKDHNILFIYLFEAKSRYHSFKNRSFLSKLASYINLIFSIILLFLNIIKMIFFIIRFRPKGILSAGGFTAVPAIYAAKITNVTKSTSVKIIIHQQDPDIGLTNKITSKFANYLTCVFQFTKNDPLFGKAKIIYNPIDSNKFDTASTATIDNKFANFFEKNKNQKTLLIFGGGSGAEAINKWVWENEESLLRNFSIIHLTGNLQNTKPKSVNSAAYLSLPSVYDEMPYLIQKSNLVLCRAGMSSISELLYLSKNAFLVPIPNSHQENNANQVKDYFEILDQRNTTDWLQTILLKYPTCFEQKVYPKPEDFKNSMTNYISDIRNILDK
ncbi:MAG: UDP-N-acetylglucosamine--N-acetylmuramyl-(pentapeptide) pyrophosphoryl-undecaprenol N-acetylglucosamine transferase [candidate division SR1 bacterium]|nr:UDP-N-acetylglucosamine--N-acetylmuramyl-(pentapeptide) pyrophosphoryl-undecaprenol N-acetylglucosamine transferase [candidate division SR1 bacterium]